MYETDRLARRGLLRLVASVTLIATATTARAEDATMNVKIDNFTFTPPLLRIKQGTSVTWTNDDDIPHTIVLTNLGTRSKTLDTDATFTCQFQKTGTFNYICGLHPHMKGQVIVTA